MEIREVPATVRLQQTLPAPAHELWARGELLDELGIRDDGRVRVEIIGGEIVVSPGPTYDHAGIVGDLHREFNRAQFADPDFPWRPVQNTDFNLDGIAEDYLPDLVVVDTEVDHGARKAKARFLLPRQIALAVEVTSRWNADDDREPGPKRERQSKWNGYALVGVPHCLLIDRDPRRLTATLYSVPDSDGGVYQESRAWRFGEELALPEPFGVTVPTGDWDAWDED